MAGIYLHIPFCKSRCLYCDFFTGADECHMDEYVDALCREIALRKDELGGETIKTIYFGGGTPSRLQAKHLSQIFGTIFSHFSLSDVPEITLEANPEDLSRSYIEMLATLPFNRLSIGIQSFDDDELTFLNRRHTAKQAMEAIQISRKNGFENISIDLMYGLPKQTQISWEQNLQQAIRLNIPHISAYHLIFEEHTRMYALWEAGKIVPVDEEVSTAMFSSLIDVLSTHGFEHYEISNFAKHKQYARHNTAYWQGAKYIGLGAAAHSFDGDSRSWNVASFTSYLAGIAAGKPSCTTEHLSVADKYNECVLTGLRTMWGINLNRLTNRFGEIYHRYCMQNAEKYLNNNLLKIENKTLKFTREGIFISDMIMSELIWI